MYKRCKIVYINNFIYVLSDDEIKEGDWYCEKTGIGNLIHQTTKNSLDNWKSNDMSLDNFNRRCKKIIATTDSSLTKGWIRDNDPERKLIDRIDITTMRGVPSIPQSFINKYVSEYNKGNKIEEVMVEYEEFTGYDDDSNPLNKKGNIHYPNTLELNPDNTISIKSIKDSWTREELSDLKRAYEDSKLYVRSHDYREQCVQKIFHWIETNL